MNNKNWSDRADRDLFFTILSVKNIGVISGSEWVTIGNLMRVLGYGFTNEGCRQHFQGLRRAQNKAEQNGSPAGTGVRKAADPTMNPITRRPGPGRGRPKKSNGEQATTEGQPGATPAPAADVTAQAHDAAGQPTQASNPHFTHHYQQPQQGQHPVPYPPQGAHPQWQAQPPAQYHQGGPQDHQHRPQAPMAQKQPGAPQQSPVSQPSQSATYPSPQSAAAQLQRSIAGTAGQGEAGVEKVSAPGTVDDPNAATHLPLESDNPDDDEDEDEDDDDDDDDDASDDRPSKRQKTEDEDAEADGNLEDDPVLALASANNGSAGDPYATSDQFYGEA